MHHKILECINYFNDNLGCNDLNQFRDKYLGHEKKKKDQSMAYLLNSPRGDSDF